MSVKAYTSQSTFSYPPDKLQYKRLPQIALLMPGASDRDITIIIIFMKDSEDRLKTAFIYNENT